MGTYRIVRMFRDGRGSYTIKHGLTLEEAQAHCKDPETSSRTCKSKEGILLEQHSGPWFDGYEEDTRKRAGVTNWAFGGGE